MTQGGSRRTIAFLGVFGIGNIGNEASLESALAALARFDPDSHAVVVCIDPEVVAEQHGVKVVSLRMSGAFPSFGERPKFIRVPARPFVEAARWIAAFRFVRSVDTVIVPGTGILDDFGEGPRDMPNDVFRWSMVARLTRTPLFFVAVGAGPVNHGLSRELYRRAVLNARSSTYRDEGSRSFMHELGVPTGDDAVQPDVVLGLPRPAAAERSTTRQCIGVGVMAYYGWDNEHETGSETFEEYTDSMVAITSGLLDQGYEIRLLIGETTDQAAVAAVLTGLGARDGADRVIVEPIRSFSDLLAQAAQCDAVVASRYHNIVASMMMNRATVSLGYADKNRALLEDAGLAEYAFEIDQIDVEEILASTAAALADQADIGRALSSWNEKQQQRIDDHFRAVFTAADVSE